MKIVTALAASILAFTALDAQATSPVEIGSITVSYADLNLDHQAGAAALYQRIKTAAHRLCNDNAGQTLVQKRAYASCLEQAVSTAVARVDRPALTDYVAGQTGKPVAGEFKQVAAR